MIGEMERRVECFVEEVMMECSRVVLSMVATR